MAKTEETKAKPATIDKAAVITLVESDKVKPRREGSKVGKIFAQYKNGDTVEKWLTKVKPLGGGLSHLRKDMKFGRVTLKKAA